MTITYKYTFNKIVLFVDRLATTGLFFGLTAKRRITRTTPRDSPGTMVF